MSTTLSSNKPKPTRTPKGGLAQKEAAGSTLPHEFVKHVGPDEVLRMAFAREIVMPSKTGSSNLSWEQVTLLLSNPVDERKFRDLTEGTFKLVQVVLSHAALDHFTRASSSAEVNAFEEAYASIVSLVPDARRAQLLSSMREGLEKLTQTERAAAPPVTPKAKVNEATHVSTKDFMAGLEKQEAEQRARDTSAGMLVSGAQLATLLNMTPQGLHHALKAKRVFTLQGPSGEHVYPAFFADPKQDRKTLEKVSKTLGDLPGAAKWDFFTSPRVSLGKRTPLEALAKGKVDAVMAAAKAFVEE